MSGVASDFEHTDVHTVVTFVDMSGFTAYTEVHGDHRAAGLAGNFAEMSEAVLGPDDELIKTIGDAVMVTSPDAPAAVAFLQRLTDASRRIDGFPLLRAGFGVGSVIKRHGDIFGATVNTAARLAAIAEPGQIVMDHAAAKELRSSGGVESTSLGPLRLRNITSPVEVFVLDMGASHQDHVDPICRMHVGALTAELTISRGGVSYRFCSTTCLRQFQERSRPPEPVRSANPERRHSRCMYRRSSSRPPDLHYRNCRRTTGRPRG